MKTFLIALIIISLAGCKGYHFAASPHFTPVFNKEKKELVARIGGKFYQVGYSLSPHLFLFNTGSYRSTNNSNLFRSAGKENSGGITRTEHSYELDGGMGYLTRMMHKKQFSLLAGAGGGKVNTTFIKDLTHNYNADLSAHKINIFLQPNISFLFSEHTSLSLSTKLSYVRFTSIVSSVSPGDLAIPYAEDETFLNKNSVSSLFTEPGITWRIGWKEVKFEMQAIAPIKLSSQEIRYKKMALNLGLTFNVF